MKYLPDMIILAVFGLLIVALCYFQSAVLLWVEFAKRLACNM